MLDKSLLLNATLSQIESQGKLSIYEEKEAG